jgi:hypothetical protein
MLFEFKKGDRVVGNDKNPTFNGRIGTVSYVSGTDYWVKFDDNETAEGGIHGWYLEPLAAGVRREGRAA